MKLISNLIGGLAGALALNILHETVRQFDADVPRIDRIGEEGANKVVEAAGGEALTGRQLYIAALAGDIVSNSLYYSTVGTAEKKHLLWRGALTGLAAGVGALKITRKIGLDDRPINRSTRTKAMTIGYYLIGGLVAGLTIRALRRN